ncbi:MAG: endonuclease/exonuclease/phosphatase family protein, partial [Planctomycetia bacterium]
THPHQKQYATGSSTAHGIGLWSKRPLDDFEVVTKGRVRDQYWIVGRLGTGTDAVTIVGIHPPPPVKKDWADARNDALDLLGSFVAEQTGPVVVLGDLNCSPWSPYFSDLLTASRLRDARQGYGASPTWPADAPYKGFPIDHCLVSKDIAVRNFALRETPGSDHRAVLVDLTAPTPRSIKPYTPADGRSRPLAN